MSSPGRRIGRYVLKGRLAAGGMAEVWLARQEGLEEFRKDLVVKTILPHLANDPAFIRMFLDEARFAALLDHPNVVQVFELGKSGDCPFLVMEYVRGQSLRAILRRCAEVGHLMPLNVVARIAADACAGLHHAHTLSDASGKPLGLVHRDVSPDNLLLAYTGVTKVVDFGIAKASTTARLTQTGTLRGKFPYMAPEQFSGGAIDRRVDVYAVGVVLYELACGRFPFRSGSDAELMHSILNDPLPKVVRGTRPVPDEFVRIIHTAMAKNPEHRYPDAEAMHAALEQFLESNPTSTTDVAAAVKHLFPPESRETTLVLPTESVSPPTAQLTGAALPARRAKVAKMVAAGALAVMVAVLGVWLGARTEEVPPATPEQVAVTVTPPEQPAEAVRPAGEIVPSPSPDPPIGGTTSVAAIPEDEKPVTPPRVKPQRIRERSKGRERKISKPPTGPGKILVHVHPWAEVILDNRAMGVTPLRAFPASPGRHKLKLVNPELNESRSIDVVVESGKQLKVEVNLLQ
jgi:serine/threonine-protein kinase